jgi:hypothetical protein
MEESDVTITVTEARQLLDALDLNIFTNEDFVTLWDTAQGEVFSKQSDTVTITVTIRKDP